MRPTPSVPRTLPGVRFEVPAQPDASAMPRMDIALFVGFAASGPLQAAVAVESLKEFETVFGSGLQLAVDASSGAAVQGLLQPAVRGFFSQGGRRCWVLRVAGAGAQTSQFPLPSLLCAQRPEPGAPWQLAPASLHARSPGSGADAVQVAARVTQAPVRVRARNPSALQLTSAASPGLRAGDVLRLDFEPLRLHARIANVSANADTLQLGAIVGLLPLQGGPLPATLGNTPVKAAQWLGSGRLAVRLRLAPQDLPQRSQVLSLEWGPARPMAWMALDAVDITDAQGQDGMLEATFTGTPWRQALDPELAPFTDWCTSGSERLVQRLRLDLQTQASADQAMLLADLSLARADGENHGGYGVFDLPSDDTVFSRDGRASNADPGASVVAERDAPGHLQSRFALAPPALRGECLLLPLGAMDAFDAALKPQPSSRSTLERDGLSVFDWTLFAEPTLAPLSADLLADQAEALRGIGGMGQTGGTPLPLRGMHAAFGAWPANFSDEPTLLVLPDAIHPGWHPIAQPASPWTALAVLPEPPDACAAEPFRDCAAAPLPRPRFVRSADPRSDGSFTLFWTPVAPGASYTLEEALEPGFGSAATVFCGKATRWEAAPRKPGQACYRVRASLGRRLSPWSAPVRITIGANGYETLPWTEHNLLAIHRLMLRTAAGRGDMLALLALPMAFDTAQASGYAARLCATRSEVDPDSDAPPAIGDQETRALSHGALHHPWLMVRRDQDDIWFPPDGPVCGQLAAGALERGAWIALANRPLRDCVALGPPGLRPTLEDRQQLLDAQVNLLRSAATGFVVCSSDTLAAEPDWRPINVRRLMCLLRRLAVQRGQTYVFEPNGAVLQRTVERGFAAVLDQLLRRGALAGATPERAYQINVGPALNSRQRRDAGQFWVELKVAPSLPMGFLTVRLMRSGERVLSQEVH